jgi:hypothetical protein
MQRLFSILTVAVLALTFSAQESQADVVPNATYDMVIGAAVNGGGFVFGVTGYTGGFTFDGVAEVMGTDLSGGTLSINEVNFNNGDGTWTTQITLTTDSADIFPALAANGDTVDQAGWFMGSTLGGTNLAHVFPAILADTGNGASGISMGIFGFDAAGTNNWGFSLLGPGTDWDGSGGFGLTAGPVGQGTTSILFEYNYAVPEPSSIAILGMFAMTALVRRRRG